MISLNKWRHLPVACTLLAISSGTLSVAQENRELDGQQICGCSFHPGRLNIRHIEGNGIGYQTGYTTAEGFFSKSFDRSTGNTVVPFLDVRGHIFNNARLAANVGLGMRFLKDGSGWVFGANGYYDFRKTNHKSFNQVGLGLEALHSTWELRTNGYIPAGRRRSKLFHPEFDHFSGNSIILRRTRELAMYGIDGEIGAHFLRCKEIDFFAGIGPYYFAGSEARDFVGGKFRLNAHWKEYITLEGTASYDNVFKDVYQGQVTLSWPLGRTKGVAKRRCSSCCSSIALDRRLVQPVVRDEIIVVEKGRKKSVAMNPATGFPFNVLFVNNLSSSLGTFESPYSTLVTAQNASIANDIIYMFPGDATTRNQNAGIVLKDGQQLLGSSTAQTLTTGIGTVVIPPQTTGVNPLITSSSTGVVTIANNNTIRGISIDHNGRNGIVQPNAGVVITNLTLENNRFRSSNGSAMNINNLSGMFSCQNNQIDNITAPGIAVTNSNIQNASYSISNNTIYNDGSGSSIQITLTNCSGFAFSFFNNIIATSGNAFVFTMSNVTAPAAPHSFMLNYNAVTANSLLNLTASSNANASFAMLNNGRFCNICSFLSLSGNSIINFNFVSNMMDAATSTLQATLSNSAQLIASLQNNSLQGGSSHIQATLNNSSQATISAIGNMFQLGSNTADSFSMTQSGTAVGTYIYSGNFSIGARNSVGITTTGSSSSTATISGNRFLVPATGGVLITNSGNGSSRPTITDNTFIDNVGASMTVTNSGTGTTCLTLEGNIANPMQSAAGGGAYQLTRSNGTFNFAPPVDNVGVISTTGTITNTSSCN